MESPSIVDVLNAQFGLEDELVFALGEGDLPLVKIENEWATAVISLYAAHVLSYIPAGAEDALWVSREAVYETGKAIRGGIPVIWPWFGPHPDDSTMPAHGFARRQMWSVKETGRTDAGKTQITLTLTDNEATKQLFSHDFTLELTIIVGGALDVALTTINSGDVPFSYTAALHSYFNIGNIHEVGVRGLEKTTYLDNLDGLQPKEQSGAVRFDGEVDRVFVKTTAVCHIDDPSMSRTIEVDKKGSHTTVVWNPWADKAARMSDFGNDEYHDMVCVETANAFDDRITLAPNERATLLTTICVQ